MNLSVLEYCMMNLLLLGNSNQRTPLLSGQISDATNLFPSREATPLIRPLRRADLIREGLLY